MLPPVACMTAAERVHEPAVSSTRASRLAALPPLRAILALALPTSGGRGAVLADAVVYSRVLFSGIAITVAISTFDSILRGEGNVRVPSVWGTVSLSLQMVFVPLFMFPLGLGIAGAAAGMLAGQLVGSLPRAHYLFGGRGQIRPRLYPNRVAASPLREILRVGIPASLASLANYLGLLLLTAIVARYGTNAIAAFGLGTRLDFVVITLAFGIASALLTLVGLASGARDFRRIGTLFGAAATLVAALLLCVAAIVGWRPTFWLRLFTTDAEILRVGARYLRIVGPSYPFLGVSMACSFTFQGLGRAVFPLLLVAARTLLVVAAATTLAAIGAPVAAVFTLIAIGNVASSVILFARLRSVLRAL